MAIGLILRDCELREAEAGDRPTHRAYPVGFDPLPCLRGAVDLLTIELKSHMESEDTRRRRYCASLESAINFYLVVIAEAEKS